MDFLLWLASYGKVRKDELMGFLELTTPYRDKAERIIQALVRDDHIEVGSYQKLFLGRDETFQFPKAIRQMLNYGIPPYQMVAFLRNQGVVDTHEIIDEIEKGIAEGAYRSNGAGVVTVMLHPETFGQYVDHPLYTNMRLNQGGD